MIATTLPDIVAYLPNLAQLESACPPDASFTHAQPVESGRSCPPSLRTLLSVCSSPRFWHFNQSETHFSAIPVLNSLTLPFVFRLTTHGCQSYDSSDLASCANFLLLRPLPTNAGTPVSLVKQGI